MAAAGPYTRAQWNQLVQQVNTLSQSPPLGCVAPSPLQEAEADHIWSWPDDVQAMQTVLKQVCSNNTFTTHTKWEQSILDEINKAVENGWCGCSGGSTLTSWILLGAYPPEVYSTCPGYPAPGSINVDALAAGIELPILPGYEATEAIAVFLPNGANAHATVASLRSSAIATYEITGGNTLAVPPGDRFGPTHQTPPTSAIVSCVDGLGNQNCNTPSCSELITNTQNEISSNPTDFLLVYFSYQLTGGR